MSDSARAARGFGYQEGRSGGYHFEVKPVADAGVRILEVYDNTHTGEVQERVKPREKVMLSEHRWNLVASTVEQEFNLRLRSAGLRAGKWLKTATPLAPHFGKELVLLGWAIEDQDPTTIPRMLANWRGLAPEERWWFYTTVNAAGRGRSSDKPYGWRAAIKIAFLEDPQDIGLESLRIEKSAPSRARNGVAKPDVAELPAQGRLFADPDH